MPHSSGGGSHGGGHHGGSHHSSHRGGSSGTNRRHSSTYFDGARHYVYYKNKKPVHYYSDIKITEEYIRKRKKSWKIKRTVVACFYLIFFLVTFLGSIYTMPHKLKGTCVDPNTIIDTNSMISASEESQIMEQLEKFRQQTGISVTVLTVKDEEWKSHYVSLEKYAFDYYVTHLRDEKNWLLVYSEPSVYTAFNDWKWEGMQGDDTDPILTSASTDKFNREMQKNISRDGFAKAVIETFAYYNDIVMEPSVNIIMLIITMVVLAVHGGIIFLVLWLIFGAPVKIDEKSIELANPQYSYIEDTCRYCGGLYIHGIHTSCPHCGGALEPLDRPIMVGEMQE